MAHGERMVQGVKAVIVRPVGVLSTIGGFVFAAMGKIPHDGEELQRHNAKITILEAEDRKINRLRIELLAEHSESYAVGR